MKLMKFCKGQMAIVMTLAIATLLGVMALGADVGVMYYQWNQLQKGADAAALAGANYLNGGITFATANVNAGCTGQSDDAKKAACTYAMNNGLASDPASLTINEPGVNLPAGAPTPNLQVAVTRSNIPYMFGRVVGLDTYKVAAISAAKSTLPANSVTGMFPLGMQCTAPCDLTKLAPGAPVPFGVKFTPIVDTGGAAPGNWQWLASGSGANGLGAAVGSGMSGTFSIGDTITTKTGNDGNAGPVKTAWDSRMSSCASITPDPCNGGNPSNIPSGDPCLVTVPAVDFNGCSGNCSTTIIAFAQVYVEPSSRSKVTGNGTSNISACYVKAVDGNVVSGGGGLNLGAIEPPKLIQ
jgi:hypothetical protein